MASATDFHSAIKDMFTGGGSSASSTTSLTSTFEGLSKNTQILLEMSMKHFSRVEKLLEAQTKAIKNQDSLGMSDLIGAKLLTKVGGWVFTRLGLAGAVGAMKNFFKLGVTRLGTNLAEYAGRLGETVLGSFKKVGLGLNVVGSKILNVGERLAKPFKMVMEIFSTGGVGKLFSEIGGQFARLSGLLKTGGKFLGKLAWPITAILALWDGINGWQDASNLLGREITGIGGKVVASIGSILNGLLFGIPDWVAQKFNFKSLAQVLDQGWRIGIDVMTATGKNIVDGTLSISGKVKDYFVEGFDELNKSLPSMEDVWNSLPNLGQYLYDTFGELTQYLKNGIFGLKDAILGGLKGFFKDTYEGVKAWLSGKEYNPANRPANDNSPVSSDGYYRMAPDGALLPSNPASAPITSPSPGGAIPAPSSSNARQSTLGTPVTPNTNSSPITFGADAPIERPTAGMRNRNPGNIKFNSSVKWEGLVGPSTNLDQGDPQAVFSSDEAGMRAMAKLARNKYNTGMKTVSDIIAGPNGWTPGADFAVRNIAKTMGVDPNQEINLNDDATMAKFMRAVIKQEHGAAGANYSDDLIKKGITLSYQGNAGSPANDNRDIVVGNIGNVSESQQTQAGIRKGAIQPGLKARVSEMITRVLGDDYEARVYSGGQSATGIAGITRTGSNRHNEGHAGDMFIFNKKTGQQISQEEYARFGQAYLASGYGSIGLQMGTGGIHVDDFNKNKLGSGQSLTWSYDRKGGIPLSRSAYDRLQQGVAGVMPDNVMSYDDYVKKYSINKVASPITPQSVNDATQSKGEAPVESDERTPPLRNNTPVPSYDEMMKGRNSSPDSDTSKTKVGDVSSIDETKMLLVNGAMWG